jgi:hypothetical protein
MLVLRFEDDGSFHFDAVDPRSGTHIGVRVVRPWKLDIKDGSLAMSAVFHDPATQLDVESELAVIDSESIHETWKTTTGLTGDNLWQKVDN